MLQQSLYNNNNSNNNQLQQQQDVLKMMAMLALGACTLPEFSTKETENGCR